MRLLTELNRLWFKNVLKTLFFLINFALLSGCNTLFLGSYGEDHQTLEAFTQRVEQVFKLQNSMTNAVMLMEEPSAKILEIEQAMHAACKPLNDYASHEMEGLSSDFELKHRVEQTAVSCEKAAIQLQSLLSLTK